MVSFMKKFFVPIHRKNSVKAVNSITQLKRDKNSSVKYAEHKDKSSFSLEYADRDKEQNEGEEQFESDTLELHNESFLHTWTKRIIGWADQNGIAEYHFDPIENCYTGVPRSEETLLSLRELFITHCSVKRFPIEFCYLTGLKKITLKNSKLKKIPKFIFTIKGLESLTLCNGHITKIPKEILKLYNLKSLTINGNAIKNIPPFISSFRYLELLDVSNNAIRKIDSKLLKYINIEELNFAGNHFGDGSALLSDSSQRLSDSVEEKQPRKIFQKPIHQLITLGKQKSANMLQGKPSSYLGKFKNRYHSIPKSVEQCKDEKYVEYLDLSNNNLSSLPACVSHLKKLKTLNVSYNSLKVIPHEITQLKALEVLMIMNNQLESFNYEAVQELPNLREVRVINNPTMKISEKAQAFIDGSQGRITFSFTSEESAGKP